jgi:predicted MPP superfamily phosphohydrolase
MEQSNFTRNKRFSRRDFLKVLAVLGADTTIVGLAGAGYMKDVEPSWVEVTDVRLKLPRLPKTFSGFRLAQISDIHIGPWMSVERVATLLDMITNRSPDLIAITGDIVLSYVNMAPLNDELAALTVLLTKLTKQFPSVGVLGNHDYWYHPFAVWDTLRRGGVRVLRNSVMTIERNGDRLHIAGIDDAYVDRADIDSVLAELPGDGCAILLAHEPDFADTSAATGRFDLQISGHSHGGQVVLPFIGPPILPYLGKKYPLGLYHVGDMIQYTNRGVGMTLPNVRFNCRPEITIFTLESV